MERACRAGLLIRFPCSKACLRLPRRRNCRSQNSQICSNLCTNLHSICETQNGFLNPVLALIQKLRFLVSWGPKVPEIISAVQCSAVRAALCVFLLFLPLWFVWGAPEMRVAGVATGRGSSVCGVPPLLPSDLLPCRSLPSFHRLQSIKVSLPCKSKKSQQQQRQWHSSATTATASLRVLLLPVPHILYPLTVF
jgi:hypothetical protein